MPSSPTGSAGRPTRAASRQLALRIQAAAHAEFLNKGIEGASIEGIAAAAGCSKLTIYRHFGNKNELFLAVVKARSLGHTEEFQAQIDTSRQPDQVLYDIGILIAASFFKPENLKFIRLVVAEIGRVAGLADIVKSEADRLREPVRRYLDALRRAGLGKFDDPMLAAIQFINLCVLGHFYLLAGYSAEQVSPEHQEKLVKSAVTLFVSTHFPPR